jgi:ketosteroid isomerase-like protein
MLRIKSLDMKSVQTFNEDFERMFYQGDHAAMASAYAEDAKLMAEDMPLMRGREAIDNFWKLTCERAKSIGMKRTIQSEEIVSERELGYVTGTVRLEIPSPSGQTSVQSIKYVTIWKREDADMWRIVVDISNRNEPLRMIRSQ